MTTVVDGSNLGGRVGGRRGSRAASRVVELVLAWSRPRRGAVLVVFDGPPAADVADRYGRVTVRWSGGRSADDVIREHARRAPRGTRVVTDDQALAAVCRGEGAEVIGAAEFLAGVRSGAVEEKAGAAAVDVADWEAWFGRTAEGEDSGEERG